MTGWLRCPHCGLDVEGATDNPWQFEDGQPPTQTGAVYHPACAEAAFTASEGASVLMYPEGSEGGPLTP